MFISRMNLFLQRPAHPNLCSGRIAVKWELAIMAIWTARKFRVQIFVRFFHTPLVIDMYPYHPLNNNDEADEV